MSADDVLFHAGHRERLKAKLLDGKLTSYEKLELLLTFAIPRRDVRPLARSLIQKFRSVYFVFTAPIEELERVPGVGRSTAILIHLVHELMLVSYRERLADGTVLADMTFIKEYCRQLLSGKQVEEFHVMYLGKNNRLLLDDTHSVGTLDYSAAHPREIARKALSLNAISVILVHNHPMSDNGFSRQDIELTDTVAQHLRLASATVLDHLLVSGNGIVTSYRESAWANKSLFGK